MKELSLTYDLLFFQFLNLRFMESQGEINVNIRDFQKFKRFFTYPRISTFTSKHWQKIFSFLLIVFARQNIYEKQTSNLLSNLRICLIKSTDMFTLLEFINLKTDARYFFVLAAKVSRFVSNCCLQCAYKHILTSFWWNNDVMGEVEGQLFSAT